MSDEHMRALRKMARAIASDELDADEAYDFLFEAFRMGRIAGKCEAYRAEHRAKEAKRKPGGQPHG
jgi:hypothetical protein